MTERQWELVRNYVAKFRKPDDSTAIIAEESYGNIRVRVSHLLDAYDALNAELTQLRNAFSGNVTQITCVNCDGHRTVDVQVCCETSDNGECCGDGVVTQEACAMCKGEGTMLVCVPPGYVPSPAINNCRFAIVSDEFVDMLKKSPYQPVTVSLEDIAPELKLVFTLHNCADDIIN